ncbi:MAG: AI-2E family transporter [Rhodospirillaceae bacterium]
MTLTNPSSIPPRNNRLKFAIIFGLCSVVVIGLLIALGGASTPFLAGAVFAYIAMPVVDKLEAWGCRKSLGAFVVTMVFCGAFIALLMILIPLIMDQISSFIRAWPELISGAKSKLITFLDNHVPGVSKSDLISNDLDVKSIIDKTEEPASQAVNLVFSAVDLILFTVLTPFVCFFLLKDGHNAIEALKTIFPQNQRSTAKFLMNAIHVKLSGLIRGQSLVMLTQAVIHSVGLLVIGLENAVLIGVLTGLSAIVPVVGNLVLFGIALVAAFAQFNDILPLILICLLYGTSQILETAVFSPFFVGRNVRTHPLWIIFGLLVGGSLLGATGVILALPIVVITDVFISFIINERQRIETKESTLPEATAGDPPPPAPQPYQESA